MQGGFINPNGGKQAELTVSDTQSKHTQVWFGRGKGIRLLSHDTVNY